MTCPEVIILAGSTPAGVKKRNSDWPEITGPKRIDDGVVPAASKRVGLKRMPRPRRSSKVFVDQFAAGNVAFMTFPDDARPTASEGGLPIIIDGKIIGAIGISGGTGQQNGVAATAGVNAVK